MTDFRDDDLVIFIGHSADAVEQSKVIYDLGTRFDKLLRPHIRDDDNPVFRSVVPWEWNEDMTSRSGGQRLIDEVLTRADFAVFVFNARCGDVTWHELDQCREPRENRPPIAAVFAQRPRIDYRDPTAGPAFQTLIDRRLALGADWHPNDPDAVSRAVRPLGDYDDDDQLRTIVLARFERDLPGMIDRARRRRPPTSHPAPVSTDSSADDARSRATALESHSSDDSPALAAEITDYRSHAERRFGAIRLAGFETRVRVPIDLDDLYVPLRAQVDLRGLDDVVFADADEAYDRLKRQAFHDESLVPLTEAFSFATKLGGRRGLVILGDPGAGKTTQLLRLLLKVVGDDATDIGLPADITPVFLPLRDLPTDDVSIDRFLAAALDNDHLLTTPGFGTRLLATDNILFLLDGLDEVASGDSRADVSRWIEKLLGDYPNSRFVVTCRYAGYRDQARLAADFLELHLRPFETEQAEEFVRRWYHIVETSLDPNRERATKTATMRAAELIERLAEPDFRARKVYGLTRNPMLLTAICLIHRDRGQLPHRRVELYREATNILLERWREAKGLDVTISADDARLVLQPLAGWMHEEEKRTRAAATDIAPVIEEPLQTSNIEITDPETFLATIRDESGLLTGWSDDRYGFMHLGFQEYLAARDIRNRAFKDKSVLDELAHRFGQSWWQEVTLLLLAMNDPALFEELMALVVRQPAFAEKDELVAYCLDDTCHKTPKPFVDFIGDTSVTEDLWPCQRRAFELLESHWPDEADVLRSRDPRRLSPPIRSLVATPETAAGPGSLDISRRREVRLRDGADSGRDISDGVARRRRWSRLGRRPTARSDARSVPTRSNPGD